MKSAPARRQPKPARAARRDPPAARASTVFPIVGIGASAGGLEALEQFLGRVPAGSGLAFVVVQHLDPMHKGIMPALLQRATGMKVIQVKDRTRVQPDCVYVIPPNKDMSILHGVLHLLEPAAPRGLRLPIDFFLRSLAQDQQERSIGVTNFFRDPAAWEQLRTQALPALLARRPPGQALRAWMPGCSTGEEAYSLAIVLKEAVEEVKPKGNIVLQIFATDLDRGAIDKARQGVFPANIAADVSPERLRRFFTQEEHGYLVRKEIREMIIFAPQNLIMDPPFTKLDLLSCRNLLIYLAPELQKKLIPLFHYSLNPGGLLFLGSAETMGGFTDLFAPLSGKSRLFRRTESGLRPEPLEFPLSFSAAPPSGPEARLAAKPPPSLQALADQLVLLRYAPPAVLVNDKGDIFYISGHTGKYLEPAAGKANWNIFVMAREGLRTLLEAEGDIAVVGEAATGRQAVALARKLCPAVVVMDIAMPGLNGLEATRQIHKTVPGTKVLILSAHSDDAYVEQVTALGAAGYLLKQTSARFLSKAIRAVQQGNAFFSPSSVQRQRHHDGPSAGHGKRVKQTGPRLSSREVEVLQLIAEGQANKQVAAELAISVKTVEKHRQHLMEKLNIHDTAGLTRYAIAAGIIESSVQLTII